MKEDHLLIVAQGWRLPFQNLSYFVSGSGIRPTIQCWLLMLGELHPSPAPLHDMMAARTRTVSALMCSQILSEPIIHALHLLWSAKRAAHMHAADCCGPHFGWSSTLPFYNVGSRSRSLFLKMQVSDMRSGKKAQCALSSQLRSFGDTHETPCSSLSMFLLANFYPRRSRRMFNPSSISTTSRRI